MGTSNRVRRIIRYSAVRGLLFTLFFTVFGSLFDMCFRDTIVVWGGRIQYHNDPQRDLDFAHIYTGIASEKWEIIKRVDSFYGTHRENAAVDSRPPRDMPSIIPTLLEPPAGGPTPTRWTTVALGFPFRASTITHWSGELSIGRTTGITTRHGMFGAFVLDLRWLVGMPLEIPIPWPPIWIPLLANWVFWTLVVAGFAVAYYAIRDAVHRRRRICIECRYDLRASENGRCPECGTQNSLIAAPPADVLA
ncbi:MAG: hypothetical protein SF069_01140 [Phycisphaerae bacterium]|nr:hypothetical protein [Phycisphaerae bacterium]